MIAASIILCNSVALRIVKSRMNSGIFIHLYNICTFCTNQKTRIPLAFCGTFNPLSLSLIPKTSPNLSHKNQLHFASVADCSTRILSFNENVYNKRAQEFTGPEIFRTGQQRELFCYARQPGRFSLRAIPLEWNDVTMFARGWGAERWLCVLGGALSKRTCEQRTRRRWVLPPECPDLCGGVSRHLSLCMFLVQQRHHATHAPATHYIRTNMGNGTTPDSSQIWQYGDAAMENRESKRKCGRKQTRVILSFAMLLS